MWSRKEKDRKKGKVPVRVVRRAVPVKATAEERIVLPRAEGLKLGLELAVVETEVWRWRWGVGDFGFPVREKRTGLGISTAEGYLAEFVLPLEWTVVMEVEDSYHLSPRYHREEPGPCFGSKIRESGKVLPADLRAEEELEGLKLAAAGVAAELLDEADVCDVVWTNGVASCRP